MSQSQSIAGKIRKGDRVSWGGRPATVIRPPHGLFGRRVQFVPDKTDAARAVIVTDDEKHFRSVATRLDEPNAAGSGWAESQWPAR